MPDFTNKNWPDLCLQRGWQMPPPRAGAPWTEQEANDLRAQWGVLSPEALADLHGRSVGSVLTQAQTLKLAGAPVKPEKAPKPSKVAPAASEPKVSRPALAPKVEAPALPPDIKILCDAGLTENCAQVIRLAAAPHYLSRADIAQKLLLPSGVGSVMSYFQKAGLVWGIGGKGAHAAIVERACNLLQGRKV